MGSALELCLGCGQGLGIAGYLSEGGVPKSYMRTYYCNNPICPRYGLISIYKQAAPKTLEEE